MSYVDSYNYVCDILVWEHEREKAIAHLESARYQLENSSNKDFKKAAQIIERAIKKLNNK